MKTITPDMARAAMKKARDYGTDSSYNSGYLNGYADALREAAGLQYYAVCGVWQWLTPEEAESCRRAGCSVVR